MLNPTQIREGVHTYYWSPFVDIYTMKMPSHYIYGKSVNWQDFEQGGTVPNYQLPRNAQTKQDLDDCA